MKRALLLTLLVAGCSKAPATPTPVGTSLSRFRAMVGEHQALMVRARRIDESPATPTSDKEKDALEESISAKLEDLKAILKTLGPAADMGLKTKPDDPDLLEARWIYSHFSGDEAQADAALAKLATFRDGDPVIAARKAAKLRGEGKYAAARALLAAALEKKGDDPNLLAEDAASAAALNEFDVALARLAAAEARRDRLDLPFLLEFDGQAAETKELVKSWTAESAIRAAEAKADDLPRVKLETPRGAIVLELFENEAPNTVANFIDLVDRQYYDGTRFHRVIADFMAQGGDPLSRNETEEDDGHGGPGYAIADELPEGRYRRHFRGVLSMANSGPDSGGSQFFITVRPTSRLDGKHVVFGRVLEGMNVVDAIAKGDALIHAVVLRKRDHSYRPVAKD